jgi:L-2-hydroxyglutarate oxidase
MNEVVVVGGGLVGLATAWRLLESGSARRVTLLEKEARTGCHQSTHNSGVLHCGLYYAPGSVKARMAVEGIREMTAFCREHTIPHEICGKLVLAADESEVSRLRELARRGAANGLDGLEELDPAGFRRIEPHAGGVLALRVPQEGIVDYRAVCDTLERLIRDRGGEVLTGARVRRIDATRTRPVVEWDSGTREADAVVNCAGLHCDRVARGSGARTATRIVPFRGEYYTLRGDRAGLVKHLIYPTPDPRFPFLGVHFTRLIHGGVECGPNAVLALAREGYRWTDINVADLTEALLFPGLWRFLAKYPGMSASEVARSFSRARFCASLQRLVPDVRADDLAPGGAGVRAQAMTPDGALVSDFVFERQGPVLHVLNAPSPAATASLAIGGEIVRTLQA